MIRNLRVLDNFAEPDDFSDRLLNRADSPLITFNPILYFQCRELLQMINDIVHVGGPPACTAFPVLSGEQLQFPQSNISGCHQQPRIAYVVQLAADALAQPISTRLVLRFLREGRGPLLAKQWWSK